MLRKLMYVSCQDVSHLQTTPSDYWTCHTCDVVTGQGRAEFGVCRARDTMSDTQTIGRHIRVTSWVTCRFRNMCAVMLVTFTVSIIQRQEDMSYVHRRLRLRCRIREMSCV